MVTETKTKDAKPTSPRQSKSAISEVKQKKTVRKKSAPKSHKEEAVTKLRIKIVAYEHKLLDSSVRQIINTALRYDANIRGPVPLPVEIKKYTVNRSTFIYKDAREQFEMRIHKRLIDILNPNAQVIDALTNLTLPSGVNVEVKML